jgi:hypothetical protein
MKPDPNMPMEERAGWSRRNFNMIAVGGTWAVPRSGLVFRKTNDHTLELANLMPWSPAMGRGFEWGFDVPPSAEKLIEYQRDDFRTLVEAHKAAGIEVSDPKNLLWPNTLP